MVWHRNASCDAWTQRRWAAGAQTGLNETGVARMVLMASARTTRKGGVLTVLNSLQRVKEHGRKVQRSGCARQLIVHAHRPMQPQMASMPRALGPPT